MLTFSGLSAIIQIVKREVTRKEIKMNKTLERAIGLGMKIETLEKWDKLEETTRKETKGEKRILDPFKGWIKK